MHVNNDRNQRPQYTSALIPCPACGNDDPEALIWDEPDGGVNFVRCAVCGTRYDPFTGELDEL